MKTWAQIQQATLNKTFLVLTDINEDVNEYLSKMIYYANECLDFIANDIRPNRRFVDLKYSGTFNYDEEHNLISEQYKYYKVLTDGEFGDIDLEKGDYVYSNGIEWVVCKKRLVLQMPDDFISYGDLSTIFTDTNGVIENNPIVEYIDDNKILFLKDGDYRVNYYALYGRLDLTLPRRQIDRDLTKDYFVDGLLEFTGIPQSVLNVLPSYIASQILGQDDPQRATILRNEFELMSSRLESTTIYNIEAFKNEGGWY